MADGNGCRYNYEYKYFTHWQEVDFPTDNIEGYNPQIAWWLAQCCQLTYENKITTAYELKRVGFNQITFFDTNGTQAFLAVHPGKGGGKFAILAFRGTEEDSIDILTDINVVSRLFPNENLVEPNTQAEKTKQQTTKRNDKFYAHGGFLAGLQNVWGSALQQEIHDLYDGAVQWQGAPGVSDALMQLVRDKQAGEPIDLYFTGHSLGGALATLAAYKALIYDQTIPMKALYTFGAPRSVQASLADKIEIAIGSRAASNKIHRIVNYHDVVPRLPPRIPVICDFHHVGQLVYFTRKYEYDHTAKDSFQFSSGVLLLSLLQILFCVLSFKQYTPGTIKDHMISRYIRNIEYQLGVRYRPRIAKG